MKAFNRDVQHLYCAPDAYSHTVLPNHEYLDERTGVLAAMLAKRARLHRSRLSRPRRTKLTPCASTDGQSAPNPAAKQPDLTSTGGTS
jgi:hypothetical protein